jgi:hypothetical protein
MKPPTVCAAVIDTTPDKRGLGFYWRLGLSNHPRDIAAALTLFGSQKPATAKRAVKVKP